MRGKKRRCPLAAKAGGALRGESGGVVVGGAAPQSAVPPLAQPVGQTDVVRVHVGDDHTQDGQAVEFLIKHVFPLRTRFIAGDAAVHHRPALDAVQRVAQQPEVDVVERKRQAHAQPLHARRHHQGAAGLGQRIALRVVQAGFERVFGGCRHAKRFR